MTNLALFGAVSILLLSGEMAEAKVTRYELTATRGQVNLSGKKTVDFALMLNGSIPAPVLEFTEGDDAEITVRNQIANEELSIHWHGLLLPPEMDGVPYVNTPPIRSGESYTFRFKIRQNGTYWYHSHTNVQEQKGLYGAFIIHPKKKTIAYDKDVVVVLSDWSDEDAMDILRNLKKDGDYYLYKKGSMRSWLGAIQAGALSTYLKNEWQRMEGMDLSDVGYDAFLINGQRDLQLLNAQPGQKIRIRIINAAGSSYFYVSLGQSPMKVISADGVDIQPVMAKEILIGMAETHDVLFEPPAQKNYELKITAQDGTGTASGWIGAGEKVQAPIKPMPDFYAPMDHGGMSHSGMNHGSMDHGSMDHGMNHDGNMNHNNMNHNGANHESMNHMNHANMSHGSVIDTLTVEQLRAVERTEFPQNARVHNVKLELDGDMSRYVWHINGKAIHEDRVIEIHEGDVVRFHFINKSMMHHPMHLHGHFFRVLNKSGPYSPLKHTVDVPPHGERTIEFLANEPGDWMLHCHNLFHMKTGMARVVTYSSFTPKKEIAQLQKQDPHLHDHWYFYGMAEAATNHAQAEFRLSQTWNQIEARIEARNPEGKNFSMEEEWDFEGDLFYRRWFNQFFNVLGGVTSYHRTGAGAIGLGYTLPLLIETDLVIDHEGNFRLDFEKHFQWTKTIFTDAEFSWRPAQGEKHDTEFEISLMYSPSWKWAAGLMVTNDNVGAGLQVQF